MRTAGVRPPAGREYRSGSDPETERAQLVTETAQPATTAEPRSYACGVARPLRVQVPGGAFHVLARAVAGRALFRDALDRRTFLDVLATAVALHGWSCHAFCLMTTHYHLLLRTPEGDLARGMHRLNGSYAQGFNRRHGTVGHVFESRYASILVDKESHLLELCRYLALNPVRAGACDDPAAWQWSSYRAAIGLEPAPPFLTVDWLLDHFGADRDVARRRLRAFVADALR